MVLEENIRSIREALGVGANSNSEIKDSNSNANGDNDDSAWGNHLDALGDKGPYLYDVRINF